MSNQFIGENAFSIDGALVRQPKDLPHGLVCAPPKVRDIVVKERSKFRPEIFTAEAEERLTSELTLQFHFESFDYEVLYRSTPQGPEVLAIGDDEITAWRQGMTSEEQRQVRTWLP